MRASTLTIYKDIVVPIIALVVIPFGVTVIANLHAHDVRISENSKDIKANNNLVRDNDSHNREDIQELKGEIKEVKGDVKELLKAVYSLQPSD